MMTAHPLRQPAPQMVVVADPMPETAPTMEAMATPAPQPIAPAVSPMHSMTANVQAIGVAPAAQQAAARPAQTAPRGGLFAEPSRPVAAAPAAPTDEPPRVSLFSTVTGAFRRRQAAAAMAAEPANPARAGADGARGPSRGATARIGAADCWGRGGWAGYPGVPAAPVVVERRGYNRHAIPVLARRAEKAGRPGPMPHFAALRQRTVSCCCRVAFRCNKNPQLQSFRRKYSATIIDWPRLANCSPDGCGMDGLPQSRVPEAAAWCQRTLKAPIGCVGVGLHSGRRVSLTLQPAAEDHGIVFRRTDLGRDIPARFDHVVDTRLSTVLADSAGPPPGSAPSST